MSTYIIAGLMIVITTLILFSRMNLRRFLGYPNTVDITFTLGMMYMFHDTFSGIVAGAFAGVFMSVLLSILRGIIGAERIGLRFKWRVIPVLYWVKVPAHECRPHWIVRALSFNPKVQA